MLQKHISDITMHAATCKNAIKLSERAIAPLNICTESRTLGLATVLVSTCNGCGAEERRIAIEKGNFHEGVPSITVICDGGWSKRSHKHSYNAMVGCAIIIGAETGKLLHIGVTNKHCYICSQAESRHVEPRAHRCFKNWSESSQSMESDIILEGFQIAESTHGLRYTQVIADGDSSMFAKLQENVPIWGKSIGKVECANHICKCLRSNLEKLVDENPLYKGKNRFPKSLRVRLVSSVRCAVRMRSKEEDKNRACKLLEHDIRNSVHHLFGNHSKCSDFCKKREQRSESEGTNFTDENEVIEDTSIPDIIQGVSDIWKETTSTEMQEESRYEFDCNINLDAIMLKDISILLDRVASKTSRLIGNHTTNLAECWMSIRSKFDVQSRFIALKVFWWLFTDELRTTVVTKGMGKVNENQSWPSVLQLIQGSRMCTSVFQNSKKKPEIQARRWKRKYNDLKISNSKKARMDYGPEAVDSFPDLTPEQLEVEKKEFMEKHINLSVDKIKIIENATKKQSCSATLIDERKKRLTASNFGSFIKRNPSIPVNKLVQSLLYLSFKGYLHTRKGLLKESMTVREYITQREGKNRNTVGLLICKENNFLAASPDGIVREKTENHNVSVGLLEIKNLLHSKPIDLYEASQQISTLKRNHIYYYQVQGQLNISNYPWADFVVRTMNPYQLHTERINIDRTLWKNTMLPKLKAFYFNAILPELAAPRYNTISGIREPGLW
ncbi:hypothetical protein KUTeg_022816, partial [Tegillarca granosa]